MTQAIRNFLRATLFGVLALLGALAPGFAQAANPTCYYASGQGTAPSDYQDYCWLDFSTYNDTTARSAGGQAFTFSLPDGSTLSMNVKVARTAGTTNTPYFAAVTVPSWTGAAFGNVAFMTIGGSPVLYTQQSTGVTYTVTMSGISVTPPYGGTATYGFIAADGESTNSNELLSFQTNGDNWTQLAHIVNTGNYAPTVSGLGTTTVTETGTGNPSADSYIFGSFGNPTSIIATVKAGGLQGFLVAVRYASVSVTSAFTATRASPNDQITYSVQTTGGATLASHTTSGTALNGFAPANVPTLVASYPFVVTEAMAAGSTYTLANYATTLTCTNGNTGTSTTTVPTNDPVTSYTFASLQYGDAIACTFSNVPPITVVLGGAVYSDANHNGSMDETESGTGLTTLDVKLANYSGGVCQSPANAYAAVNSATGAYSFSGVLSGSYCLILNGDSTLSDITPALPSGWIGTQNSSGSVQVTIGSNPPSPVNFGLYHGATLTGTAFNDDGAGGGTANNGVKDGSEPGLAGVGIATSSASVSSTSSAGDGTYTLWIPSSVSGTLTITASGPDGDVATGGSAGNTGGSYTRPSVRFTPVAGQTYSGVNFGFAGADTLGPNGAQTAQPGTTVYYAHTMDIGATGQISFSLANTASPGNSGWTQVLYQDSACSGTLNASDPVISAPVNVNAGQQLCLIVKQFVPAGANSGAQNAVTLSAAVTYLNANPALASTLTATDVTTVGQPGTVLLTKMVSNVTQGTGPATSVSANPGDTLQYTLTATNNGSQPVSTLAINDATPAFTTFLAGVCPGSAPSGLGTCTPTMPSAGASGAVQWSFNGTLAAGAQVVVTYTVKVSQ
jgi:uncharacterized repeat protein (TIGR01451 family)